VEFLQFWACAAVLVALEDFDVVFQLELFEEPDDPLGAGLLEVILVKRSNRKLLFDGVVAIGHGKAAFTCNVPVDIDLCALLIRHCGWLY
jgi:hypothetical protein